MSSHLQICIFIIFSFCPLILSWECTINDFNKHLSSCDPQTNTRNLTYYFTPLSCQLTNQSLVFYSKNPSIPIPCDTRCPPGHKLSYNSLLKATECVPCPINTFNFGSDLNVLYWTSEIIALFDINCNFYDNNTLIERKKCTDVIISSDKKILILQEKKKENMIADKIEIDMVFSYTAVSDGNLVFEYNKTAIDSNGNREIKGEFEFFFDYTSIEADKETKGSINETKYHKVFHNYLKGNHQFALKFVFNIEENKNIFLAVKSLKVTNAFDVALECEECFNPNPFEASALCRGCSISQILTPDNKCQDCNANEISINNVCEAVPKCDNEVDFHIGDLSEKCEKNIRTIFYTLDKNIPIFCHENDNYLLNGLSRKNFIKTDLESNCNVNEEKIEQNENEVKYCSFISNEYKVYNFELKNNFFINSNFFDNNILDKNSHNFLTNGKYLYVPKNVEAGQKYIFHKIINIVSYKGSVTFNANVTIDELKEEITLTIGNKIVPIQKNDLYIIDLVKGEYDFNLVYEKKIKDMTRTDTIPIKIDYFQIKGGKYTNLPNDKGYSCESCPSDYLSDPTGFNCLKQNEQSTAPNSTEIINKTSIITQREICPEFTIKREATIHYPNNTSFIVTSCDLAMIMEYKKSHLKFNIKSYSKHLLNYALFHSMAQYFISSNSGTTGNLIGPLQTETSSTIVSVYLSVYTPLLFTINKFSYSLGHVFLIEKEKKWKINPKYKTLGRIISSVNLVDSVNKSGIVVTYTEGDVCDSDPSVNYSVNLYFKCDKTIRGFGYPKILRQSDNQCIYYIEARSPFFCKTCLSNELSFNYGMCVNNERSKIYQENSNCVFDNIHNDFPSDEIASVENGETNLVRTDFETFDSKLENQTNKNKLILKNEYQEKIHYIINKLEYEQCSFQDFIENNYYLFTFIVFGIYAFSLLIAIAICIKYIKIRKKVIQFNNIERGH